MSTPQRPQRPQRKPKGYEQLSEEFKQMWDDIETGHPWIKRDKDGNPI